MTRLPLTRPIPHAALLAPLAALLLGGCVQVVVPDPALTDAGSAAAAGALLGAMVGSAVDAADARAYPPAYEAPPYPGPYGGTPKR
ncbi:hypothetical protein [Roseomonas sp. BN140053]|uniref:hypothetical protein n=1 Tax=Roseomonas sp. BN140053 TaxID=3391898 RepID=UPI0039EA0CBE